MSRISACASSSSSPGFLITGLLVSEEKSTCSISLRNFYIRRTLRIFPAYFVFLGVVALLDHAGVIEVPTRDFVHAVTYTMNYAPDRAWSLGHLWSLTTADALAVGCFLALSRDALFARPWYRRAVVSTWFVPVLLLVGLAIALRFRPSILLGQTIISVAIAMGIDRCVRIPDGLFGSWLNSRPLVFVGTLSYSPLNVCAAAACAPLSYYLIERPVLRRRARAVRPAAIAAAVMRDPPSPG